MGFTCSPVSRASSETLYRKDIMTERIVINGVAYIRQAPVVAPVKPRRWYGGASLSQQEKIDGYDDDPEKRLNRSDDERDNAHTINHDADFALPCLEVDDEWQTKDRFEQYDPDQVFPDRK